ncbi:MAG: 6-bladed beta-propeller [Deltaproteobacteria bacterium]|nr:6-bladed beta-propeller [Deltaproteobacteria bacterium]
MSRAWLAMPLVAACASTPPKRELVVWPSPPDVARIRFERAFGATPDIEAPSFWSKLSDALFGKSAPSVALKQPMGVAISDDESRLYIADYGLGKVVLVDFAEQKMSVFAPDEPMGKVFNVGLDHQESVYVTDVEGVIRVFSRAGEPLRRIGAGQLKRPTGLAIDRRLGRVYVADRAKGDPNEHRVLAYTLSGEFLFFLGPKEGEPGSGANDGSFFFPTYVAVAPDTSEVFVADTLNFRVQVFDSAGKFVSKFGSNGDGPGAFQRIKGLAFDAFGNLYVVDGLHSNVQIFNRTHQTLMYFGGYAKKLEYFDIPSGITIHPKSNRIFVCNEYIARINVYELINTKPEDSTSHSAAAGP